MYHISNSRSQKKFTDIVNNVAHEEEKHSQSIEDLINKILMMHGK